MKKLILFCMLFTFAGVSAFASPTQTTQKKHHKHHGHHAHPHPQPHTS